MVKPEELRHVPSSTIDITNNNIEKLKGLFPEIVNEGHIDFEKLRVVLGDEIDNSSERYSFTWHGKKAATQLAQQPTSATLKPNKEKSKNWDNTKNIYIEGDNLESLKILQKSYSNKVKMIYIDPPYNTGKDFVYKDDFKDSINNYLSQTNQIDKDGGKLTTNLEESGRFHTNWLNMMYPRLKLSRSLLKEDGAIFVSIGNTEAANLKKMLDELFGEDNMIVQFVVNSAEGGGNAKYVVNGHEFVFVYAKNITKFDNLKRTKDIRGKIINIKGESYWIQEDAVRKVFGQYGNLYYEEILKYRDEKFKQEIDDGIRTNKYILVPKTNGMHIIGKLRNLNEDYSKFNSVIKHLTAQGKRDARVDFGLNPDEKVDYFDNPKPVSLMKELVHSITFGTKNDIILDFFSGSATTARAVLELNMEDNGNRKFILVQIPEKLPTESDAYIAGYKTITELAQKRIKLIGEKIEVKDFKIDCGFKVFELSKSNIKKWNSDTLDLKQELELIEDNFLHDSKPLDVVYEIMLKLGLDLTYPVVKHVVENELIFEIAFGSLFIVLSENINSVVADFIVNQIKNNKTDDAIVVLQDQYIENDSEKLNIIEFLNANGIPYSNILSI